tara:strand:+ start:56 stop:352 length:297 start_codon:yes stop_codon:yes gene_type:complete
MIKMAIIFSLIGTNPAIKSNTFVAHINNSYVSHEFCQKAIPKNVIQIIQKEFNKTGKAYDWKIALCIDEQTLSMTYRFSESMAQEFERKRNEKTGKSI